MRATTRAFVEDTWDGTWTLEKTMLHRAPECIQVILPSSQGNLKFNNEEWAVYFKRLEGRVWDSKVCASSSNGSQSVS